MRRYLWQQKRKHNHWELKLLNFSAFTAKLSEEFACVNDSECVHMRLIIITFYKNRIYFKSEWEWCSLNEFAFIPSLMTFIRQRFSR